MTNTFTTTSTKTFTKTSAEYLASKVATDLYRLCRYYGRPTEHEIAQFDEELTTLLAGGYVQSVEYGFRIGNTRVVTLLYRVQSDGSLSDGNPGGVYAHADIAGATWFSYLTHSASWNLLSQADKARIEAGLPFRRTAGLAPQDGAGRWLVDRSYAADGTGTQRYSFIPSSI